MQFGMVAEAAFENYHLTKDWDVDDLDEVDVPDSCDRDWGIIRQSFIDGVMHARTRSYLYMS